MSCILKLGLALVLAQTTGTQTPGLVAARGAAETAHALVDALLARNVDGLCQLTPAPFSFDGVEARSREEVRRAWTHVLQRHAVSGRKLGGIELLSYEDLVKRYGAPPERLAALPLAGSEAAVVDLGGRPTIILMKKRGTTYVPFAITD
jgi:hypothetical protein